MFYRETWDCINHVDTAGVVKFIQESMQALTSCSQMFPDTKDNGPKTLRYRQFPKIAVQTQNTALIPEISS